MKCEYEYWLVQKAIRDKTILNELFEQVYPIVQKYISVITKNSLLNTDDKQDIANDAMLECFKKLEKYTGESKFSVFACGFAWNIFLQYRKRITIRNTKEVTLGQDNSGEEDPSRILGIIDMYNRNPLQIIIEKAGIERIIASIKKLKPEYEQVLQMRLFAEKSEKEIADIAGCSEDAVSKRYRRALMQIQKILEDL